MLDAGAGTFMNILLCLILRTITDDAVAPFFQMKKPRSLGFLISARKCYVKVICDEATVSFLPWSF